MRQFDSKLPRTGTTIFTQMSELAAKHQAINLSQGFPDFDGPSELLNRVDHYIQQGANQYAPMTGVPTLRQAIQSKLSRCYNHQADVDTDITVTSGATEALFATISAFVQQGDEVIVFDPAYDSYDPAIRLNGGIPVHIALLPPSFAIDWQTVANAVTEKTKIIIVNSPHNPTGTVFSSNDLDALYELAEQHDLLVLSDEVYEHIVFEGAEHQSVLRHKALAKRSVVVSSFGKTYHTTGWKIGYCVAPAALMAEVRKVHQYLTFSSSTPMQLALADYLAAHPEHDEILPSFYQQKRDFFNKAMSSSRFTFTPSPGTYFQLMDYSAIQDIPDSEFALWLIETAGVAAIPISVFYQTPPEDLRLVRFCFAKQTSTLSDAAKQLITL
ncbi:Methionine aminotransferase [Marinomonas gallaica]|uniref:Methionine aminotransferase n=1 Tax=Marinomonas gallaica TaxID=1806667 RepID=A0A1C3JST0_9GAMM|nr:methionine aminotransferase [Marinomonas gallaica]SBT18100.1 Methionine aminotransferase [Marinomonas gallaica]SBT22480.1 Methionine aminotransferase [Marinomonas gallaica]